VKTHVSDPAPFVMAGKGVERNGFSVFSEKNAKESGLKFKSGASLTEAFIKS
jgi:2,3-bisphosphoglycerate-independent phosphoglycerate mutase